MGYAVLLIEDHEANRELLSSMLSQRGHTVIPAASGTQGLQEFEKRKFDCIVSDFILPDINGIEVVKKVRKVNDKVGVVMVTGISRDKVEEECDGLGVWAVIEKPVKEDCLVEKVEYASQLANMTPEKEAEIVGKFDAEATKMREITEDLSNETGLFRAIDTVKDIPETKNV